MPSLTAIAQGGQGAAPDLYGANCQPLSSRSLWPSVPLSESPALPHTVADGPLGDNRMTRLMTLALVCLAATIGAGRADRIEHNLQRMLGAARLLEFEHSPNPSAYLLTKQTSQPDQVAVIFGYFDNGTACEELAAARSSSGTVGEFKCSPIFLSEARFGPTNLFF